LWLVEVVAQLVLEAQVALEVLELPLVHQVVAVRLNLL
jgi:hypothetical protein